MIPAPFDYARPDDVEGAVALLSDHGDEAKVLAGGQSLLPMMKLRLAFPGLLVDIGRIEALRGVREEGDALVIGAATTHHDVVHDPLVRRECAVLAEATGVVADPQVRHRGTLGGALAHGDPAGDLPAVALALDATFVAQGPAGRRAIPAAVFFRDYFATELGADEVLVEVRFPRLAADQGWGHRYLKFSRASHMWAIVGACAVVQHRDGVITDARIGLTHMGAVPVRATAVEQALLGRGAGDVAEAAALADADTDPPTDLNARADYRRHLARVLTRRALQDVLG